MPGAYLAKDTNSSNPIGQSRAYCYAWGIGSNPKAWRWKLKPSFLQSFGESAQIARLLALASWEV